MNAGDRIPSARFQLKPKLAVDPMNLFLWRIPVRVGWSLIIWTQIYLIAFSMNFM